MIGRDWRREGDWRARTWRDIKAKPVRHWTFVVIAVVAGLCVSRYFDENYVALELRYQLTQLMQGTAPRPIRAHRVTLVMIGDDEFWKGKLDRRIPIKRDYLACLLRKLDTANPSVIGLDYILRSPVSDGTIVESPAYRGETQELISAIEDVSRNRSVVLPSTFDEEDYDERDGSYRLESSILDSHHFANPRVRFGYANLFQDTRRVPIRWRIRGFQRLYPSFSLALARADDPRISFPGAEAMQDQSVFYGRFMDLREFPNVAAADVMRQPNGTWRELVANRIVIIGSFCHGDAFDRGPFVDGFLTPVGMIPGAVVHANYVEAWVDSRVIPILPGWLAHVVEVAISLAVSVLFVLRIRPLTLWLGFLLIIASAVVMSYFALQLLGLFFDPYFTLLFVLAHSAAEKIYDWRTELKRYREAALKSLKLGPGNVAAGSASEAL